MEELRQGRFVRLRRALGLFTVTSLVGLAFWVGWYIGVPATVQNNNISPPGVKLTSLGGTQLGLTDFLGKVVIVDFWTTWCGPCRLQAEILENLYLEYGTHGVQFLAVSVAEEAEIVREFVADRPFRYPVLLDSEERLSEPLGVFSFPTVMIVDRQGQVAYLRAGISPSDTLKQELHEVGVEIGAG